MWIAQSDKCLFVKMLEMRSIHKPRRPKQDFTECTESKIPADIQITCITLNEIVREFIAQQTSQNLSQFTIKHIMNKYTDRDTQYTMLWHFIDTLQAQKRNKDFQIWLKFINEEWDKEVFIFYLKARQAAISFKLDEQQFESNRVFLNKYELSSSEWTVIASILFEFNDTQKLVEVIANKAMSMKISTNKMKDLLIEDFLYIITSIYVENKSKIQEEVKERVLENENQGFINFATVVESTDDRKLQESFERMQQFIQSPKLFWKQCTFLWTAVRSGEGKCPLILPKSKSASPSKKQAKAQNFDITDVICQVQEKIGNAQPHDIAPEPKFRRTGTVAFDNKEKEKEKESTQKKLDFDNEENLSPANKVFRNSISDPSASIALQAKIEEQRKQEEEDRQFREQCRSKINTSDIGELNQLVIEHMVKVTLLQRQTKKYKSENEKLRQQCIKVANVERQMIQCMQENMKEQKADYISPMKKYSIQKQENELKQNLAKWQPVLAKYR